MNKHKPSKKLAALLALSLSTSAFTPMVASAGYEEYDDIITYGKMGYEAYQQMNQAQKAEQAVEGATQAIEGATQAAEGTAGAAASSAGGVGSFGDAIGAAGAVMGAVGTIQNFDPSDVGGTAKSIGDLALASDKYLGTTAGAGISDAMGIVGSVFGQKISESVSYRSVGNGGKYECTSSNAYPTINESFSVQCVGIPTGDTSFIIRPTLNLSAHPTHGGKGILVDGGVPYQCDKYGCWPNGYIAVTVEYNTYEGNVSMGGDMFLDFTKTDQNQFGTAGFGEGVKNGGYEFEGTGADFGGFDMGAITGAVGGFYSSGFGDGFGQGYYGPDGQWNQGESPFSGGYYDSSGAWHYSDGQSTGGYDWNSGSSSDIANSAFRDGESSFNAGSSDWGSSGGSSGGYYDENGGWHDGENPYSGGHYDSNGNWQTGGSGGYYDAGGNWHEGESPYGSDNLDGYFGDEYGSDSDGFSMGDGFSTGDALNGTVGMSNDLTGYDNSLAGVTARDALANGGHVGEDGIIYDADGNAWGSAEAAGLIAMEEGSDQLNNVLAQGGWIDERGNVHDANGNIVGYVVPAGSKDDDEDGGFGDSWTEQAEAILQQLLGASTANSGEKSLMDRLAGSESGSILSSVMSTFGMASAEDIRKETMTPQQMYDMAAGILKALGYTDADISAGKNYDKDSAYTEPEKAWDLNRITTLQKSFRIDTHIREKGKKSSMTNAAGKFGAISDATRGQQAGQSQGTNTK